jgi:hypothetical protein
MELMGKNIWPKPFQMPIQASVLRQQLVQCPYTITMYNKHMGGVDKNDQLKAYYSITCHSKKNGGQEFF